MQFHLNLLKTVNTNLFIQNSSTALVTYVFNKIEIPIVAELNHVQNKCYVTSFTTQYILYVQEEVLKSTKYSSTQKIIVRYFTPLILKAAQFIKIANISWINNSLVSTPLYHNTWNTINTNELVNTILKKYPNKTIAYRSVVPLTNPILFKKLKNAHYLPLMGRQIYIFDPKTSIYKKKRSFQMDKKLAEKQQKYYWSVLNTENEKELDRIFDLYQKLYLEKHSVYNPIYTKVFIKNGIGNFKLRFEVLKDKDTDLIVAVQGIHETESIINTSFIGYDQTIPQKEGLYRLMNYELMRQAIEKEKILNMSSGAGDFKLKRGGVATFEYQMIYTKNLSFFRLRLWKFLAKKLDKMAKKQMMALKI